MKKSVWILNHYAITPDMSGGSRHYDLSKELVKKGYNVTIFASSFNHAEHKEKKISGKESWKIEEYDGITFVWLKTTSYQRNNWRRIVNMLEYMVQSYRIGKKMVKTRITISKPDAVVGSSMHLFAVLSAYYLARFYKAKFIMEVRDIHPQTMVDMGILQPKSLTARIMYALEKFLYNKSDKIITLLPLAGDYITKYGISREKIIWIPNGVNLALFDKTKSNTVKNGLFNCLYLGSHGQANNLDVLLDTAEIIQHRGYKNIRFTLVGDGTEKQRLIKRKEDMKLNNVDFQEIIVKSEVPNYISKFDACIFILLNMNLYKYGISLNKIFDYLASSKPIIMSGNPINNLVNDSNCGISVPSDDPMALADAVIKIYSMPLEERNAMGKRGFEYVKKFHDIQILAEKFIDCIED